MWVNVLQHSYQNKEGEHFMAQTWTLDGMLLWFYCGVIHEFIHDVIEVIHKLTQNMKLYMN